MPALTVEQLCKLAVAANADRETSYIPSTPSDYGRYTRGYNESVDRVLAKERISATREEHALIYILAACGEACDYALAYLDNLPK